MVGLAAAEGRGHGASVGSREHLMPLPSLPSPFYTVQDPQQLNSTTHIYGGPSLSIKLI